MAAASPDSVGGLLVTGGMSPPPDSEYLSTTEVFQAGSWAPGPSLPYSVHHHCQVLAGDQVVVAGGSSGSEALGKTWVMESSGWAEVGSMGTARYFHACTEFAGKIYSVGGTKADGTLLSSVEVYDPAARFWSPGPQLPVGIKGGQAVTFEDSLYLLSGETVGGRNREVFRLPAPGQEWEVVPGADIESVSQALVVTCGALHC